MSKPTCRATNRRGEPCRKLAIADGLCLVHKPGGQDMKALARAGGKARHKPNPERVNESLREYLKREVPPATVWKALQAAMEGQNESARVSASRVLMDALAEPAEKKDGCWRCAQQGAELARLAASCKVLYGVMEAEYKIMAREKVEWQYALEQLEQLAASMTDGNPEAIVRVGDVSVERAQEVFESLEEFGLLIPRGKVVERAEQIAQERLQALKAEHGLAGVT